MPEPATSRFGLIGPSPTDLISSGDDVIRAILALIDANGAMYAQGTAAARPAFGKQGRFYEATDTGIVSYDTGAAWVDINPKDAAAATASLRTLGTGATQAAAGNDTRLSDARTPLAHAASHRPGGTDELAHLTLSAAPLLEVGILNQKRAGRVLTLADFTTLCGLPAAPVGLFNLGDLTNLGGGGALTNKGTVPFGAGITGNASEAAVFAGSTGQALYHVDIGGGDPFRVGAGTVGCWFRTAKRSIQQALVAKWGVAASQSYQLAISTLNVLTFTISTTGSDAIQVGGSIDVCDDNWHFAVATFDGARLSIYVDGVLDRFAPTSPVTGSILQGTAPFTLGLLAADATVTAAGSAPFFGRMDETFVTNDVLGPDQIATLMATKIAHGLAVTPNLVAINVRRRKKGGQLAVADFPATPLSLYTLAATLTDLGSRAVNLASGAQYAAGGADGAQLGGRGYTSAGAGETATDAGLVAGTNVRSYGIWFKTTSAVAGGIIGWGTLSTADARLIIGGASTNQIVAQSAADAIVGPIINDGLWHFAVVVEDNAAADGVKRKLYLDGKLVGISTVLNSITLAGAAKFRIGANPDGTSAFTGQAANAFVCAYAMTPEQILGLYAKGSQALPASPKDAGYHVEAIDATNVYVRTDGLESQHTIDLRVAA